MEWKTRIKRCLDERVELSVADFGVSETLCILTRRRNVVNWVCTDECRVSEEELKNAAALNSPGISF